MATAQGESLVENGVSVHVEKIDKSTRRIRAKIAIQTNLETMWSILTDYEKWSDILPNISSCKVIEKKGNLSRVCQTGQRNLPLGVKLSSKSVLDFYEKDLESLPNGKKRVIEFKMSEGDCELYEGNWAVEQINNETTLSYSLDVKPGSWVPLNLLEGKISKDIKTNLTLMKEAAHKKATN